MINPFFPQMLTALLDLRDAMLANDDDLNDDTKPGGSTCPTGEDYNDLFDLVLDALRAAGISTERKRP